MLQCRIKIGARARTLVYLQVHQPIGCTNGDVPGRTLASWSTCRYTNLASKLQHLHQNYQKNKFMSAYCTLSNISKLVSKFILNFIVLFTSFCKQQEYISILKIYKFEIRNQHTCLSIITLEVSFYFK